MGQYFKVFNLDKKEKLTPHRFHDGQKLLEFGCSSNGTLTGLTILLRQSSGVGGGDFVWGNQGRLQDRHLFPLIGSWAGDRVSIVGDYDDSNIYFDESYKDISKEVVELMRLDSMINDTFKAYEEAEAKWKN